MGNVWEWTSSLYMPYPYDETDGREDLKASGARVFRGGSWYYSWGIRTFDRGRSDPEFATYDVGFRCALPKP